MTSKAFVPSQLSATESPWLKELLFLTLGVVGLALLAQVAIPLPWTPVPITGQTFGVTLMALLWGGRRAPVVMASYLGVGYLGLPVFSGAAGAVGLAFSPTIGYLIGMFFSAALVGQLADRGWANSFWKALGAAYMGSTLVFGFGLWVLSYFVPTEGILIAGLYPFLLGDLIKNSLAALAVSRTNH